LSEAGLRARLVSFTDLSAMSHANPSTARFSRLRPHGGLPITSAMGGRHRRSRIADDAGFALVEALIGAVVLIVVAVATLGAIDRAQKTSGFGKNRSVAAALAEQDQARMRGLPADSLSTYGANHAASRTVTINGLNYTVASTVDWIRDSTGGTLSCTNNSSQADYLKLTSTVSANSIQPVRISSLSSPPLAYSSSRGTLVVQVNDGATPAVGVQGVSVTISGPTSMTGTTNALGCAVFSFIPAGNYDIDITKSGYVDYGGDDTPEVDDKTVTGGSLTTQPFIYDVAGSIDVNFETDISPNTTPVISRSRGYNASAFNALVPAPQFRFASDPSPPVPTVTLTKLFPFRTAYNTYAGTCAASNPKTAASNPNWFNSGNIGFDDNAIVPPNGSSVAVTVRQPALEVRVKDTAGNYINGANVVITQSGTGCLPASFTGWTTVKHPLANTDGWITKPQYNFGAGNVTYDPGVPFGTYSVCADAVTGTAPNRWRRKSPTNVSVTVNNAAGSAPSPLVDVVIPTTGSTTSTC
jgi:Tfp pilus assembly protein PilV